MTSRKSRPEMSDPYATIGYALKMAQQALRTRMDAGLREIGLTTPQYAVLTYLKNEAGASNATLARRAFVTPQTMQGILVALERADLIVRTADPDHGRVQKTELTAAGIDALDAASGIVADAERRLRDASIPEDPKAVAALLLRLAEALR
ncbi:MAG: MarR family transcriptional regulator [Luteibacter sp.]|uniref:MarR family winged helix-turn-helix transcriptional regulator n=1 Tax=Luteibacter sp. TaxID=1886636 RepID=UPI002806AA13|nr:MarR family transcriptional regulator [Luteibacter sp.]MDQ7994353.1 MarR family transcriptional regulator [Luteibacter sp.]MDQ8048654.1 MarR family transcriptional regulator [Luteibacter sp.]